MAITKHVYKVTIPIEYEIVIDENNDRDKLSLEICGDLENVARQRARQMFLEETAPKNKNISETIRSRVKDFWNKTHEPSVIARLIQ